MCDNASFQNFGKHCNIAIYLKISLFFSDFLKKYSFSDALVAVPRRFPSLRSFMTVRDQQGQHPLYGQEKAAGRTHIRIQSAADYYSLAARSLRIFSSSGNTASLVTLI